jgi:aspartate carbamoyltransferase catalytic subunit
VTLAPAVASPRERVRARRHLLDVADLDRDELYAVLDEADAIGEELAAGRSLPPVLRGRRVVTLFYEASTRTRVSFEIAARALGAEVVSVSASASSVTKGESLVDTVRTLEALGAAVVVMRHGRSGAPYLAARVVSGHVVNGGDGWHAHPTQALLDLLTLRRAWGESIEGRKVVILGDVLHSRVARSNVWSLTTAGAEVWLAGPATLLRGLAGWAAALAPERRVIVTSDADEALRDADAVMALRLQRERMAGGLLPSTREYVERYGLTAHRLRLAQREAVVLHPGPMNEGVEIAADVAAGEHSLVTRQVTNGVAVRAAVLAILAGDDGIG